MNYLVHGIFGEGMRVRLGRNLVKVGEVTSQPEPEWQRTMRFVNLDTRVFLKRSDEDDWGIHMLPDAPEWRLRKFNEESL